MKRTVLLFIILLSFSFTQDRSVVITGTCLLQGESDHSDIAVYFQNAGYHQVIWNADTHSSGVYFVKMVAGSYVNTQKLMLVK